MAKGTAMAINRRQFLLGAGGLAAAATAGGLTACAPGARNQGGGNQGGNEGGATTVSLAWWGNPTRNKNTQAEIDAYMKANPNVKIESQPGEFASYWEKLATQTAGGTAPDIIQMEMDFPDDTTWTWDDMMEVAAEVGSKGGVPFGLASFFGHEGTLGTWLRQNG